MMVIHWLDWCHMIMKKNMAKMCGSLSTHWAVLQLVKITIFSQDTVDVNMCGQETCRGTGSTNPKDVTMD